MRQMEKSNCLLLLVSFLIPLMNQALLIPACAAIRIKGREALDMAPPTYSPNQAPTSPADNTGAADQSDAQETLIRRGYRNITIVYVAGIVVCLSIFALTYYIAYKTIFLRSAAATNPRRVRDAELLENDSSGERSGGTDALRIASLQVLRYAGSFRKVAIKDAGSSNGDGADEEGDRQPSNSSKLQLATGKGTMSARECSICLSEFVDGEDVKLLPVCSHCFHVKCIDMWLFSHTTCPICRLGIQ
ncbi:hypothetical protein GOP47_0009030 [Adiantum capillus-veneris]|uniref:RING-type domain-containing protein n=1 Tax=Adiantum capillus-veneris TaxID=13818 RepID=A0A9D4UZG6_ADICA|nr:hypothetical protein GOP47_0009030 [Adiantum capillus-veneris]